MIPKIPEPRRDKRTSFKKLTDYLTAGLSGNGADITEISFHDLTQYITAETALDDLDETVDKTIAVEVGNLLSLKTAASEMWAVAKQAPRVKDPVYHYILSWPEEERPPTEQIFAAARYTLKALGLEEHQYIVAIHVNTDNLHAHVEVNRVHPKTLLSRHIEWSQKTLHRAARELEIEYRWKHDNGLYIVVEVDGEKRIVENSRYIDPDVALPSSRAKQFETWNGVESFETWCKETPGKALKKALDKKQIRRWDDIHKIMAEHGIELQKAGNGLRISTLPTDDGNPGITVAGSKAMRFLKLADIEQQLGSFQPFDPARVRAKPKHTYSRTPIPHQDETWNEVEDFSGWVNTNVGPALTQALRDGEITTWADAHVFMAEHGIRLDKQPDGYQIIHAGDGSSTQMDTLAVPLSPKVLPIESVALEKLFGSYTASDDVATATAPRRIYKRNPVKRMIRREERRELREELYKRFQDEREKAMSARSLLRQKSKRGLKKDADRAFARLKADYLAERAALMKRSPPPGIDKQTQYMTLKLVYLQARENLKDELNRKRKQAFESLPKHKSWRAWVEEQAQLGDPAAISALRGMTYRDRKKESELAGTEISTDTPDAIPSIRPADENANDAPTIQPIRRLQWRVTNNGRVIYNLVNQGRQSLAFIDEGRRLVYSRHQVDDQALIASLEYARMKWGATITLNGGDEVFQKRVLTLAVSMGMRVANPQFHELQAQLLRAADPKTLAKSSDARSKSTEDEINKMLSANPNTQVRYADHNANGTRYKGRIAAITDTHVLQQDAPNSIVLHDLRRLMSIPKVRNQALISYQNGRGSVEQIRTRKSRGR